MPSLLAVLMAVELTAGHAGFLDESPVGHTVFSAATRIYLSPRVSVGPEVAYMRGPGQDRDLFVTGNVTLDLTRPDRRITPFLVAGGGLLRHSDRIGPNAFSSVEGAITGGGGMRVRLTEHVHASGEFRGGWEPHYRVTGGLGLAW